MNIASSRLPSAEKLQIINDKTYTLRHFTCLIFTESAHCSAHHTAAKTIWKQNTCIESGLQYFSRSTPSVYVCIKSTRGLSWELSGQPFPKRSWQWKSCVWILWGFFFSPLPLAEHFPISMRWFQETSSLWIHHNMWSSLSWEVKNTDLLSLRRERARRTVKAESRRSHPLSYTRIERCRGILRHNSMSLRLCTSNFNSSKNKPAFLCQNSLVHLFNSKEANT